MKSRSQRFDINRSRPRHVHKYTKYKMSIRIMMVIYIKQHQSNTKATFESQFMKTLSISEAELKKSVASNKKRCFYSTSISKHQPGIG